MTYCKICSLSSASVSTKSSVFKRSVITRKSVVKQSSGSLDVPRFARRKRSRWLMTSSSQIADGLSVSYLWMKTLKKNHNEYKVN